MLISLTHKAHHQAICKIFDNEVGKSRMELSLS